jgi:hypothetical protein
MKPLKKLFVILLLSTLIISSCNKDENSNSRNFRIKESQVYYDNVKEVRINYIYSGDKLIRVDYLDYDNGYVSDGGIDFEYDTQGNLVSSTETHNDNVKREEFSYEAGNGNYEQFINPGYTIFFKLGYPHSTKRLMDPPTILPFNPKLEIRN